MKKDKELFELIKAAVIEALTEFTNGGVTASLDEPQVAPPLTEEPGEDESGKGGTSEESSGGGTFGDGRPKPDAGVGVFGLR